MAFKRQRIKLPQSHWPIALVVGMVTFLLVALQQYNSKFIVSAETSIGEKNVFAGTCLLIVGLIGIGVVGTVMLRIMKMPVAEESEAPGEQKASRAPRYLIALQMATLGLGAVLIICSVRLALFPRHLQHRQLAFSNQMQASQKLEQILLSQGSVNNNSEITQLFSVSHLDGVLHTVQNSGGFTLQNRLYAISQIEQSQNRQLIAFNKLPIAEAQFRFWFLVLLVIGTTFCIASMTALNLGMKEIERTEDLAVEVVNNLKAMRVLSGHLPVAICRYRAGHVTYRNTAWMMMTGDHAGNYEDTVAIRIDSAFKLDRTEFISKLELAESRCEAFEGDLKVIDEAGAIRQFHVEGTPVIDPRDKLFYLLLIGVDETNELRALNKLQVKTRQLEHSNARLKDALGSIEENFDEFVHSLVRAVEAKDDYTAGHSERVTAYAVTIADKMGLGLEELKTIQIGCLVHDVGKIGVPDAILTKPSGLTEEEFHIIQAHPEIGARMLEGVPFFADCVGIVRWHHERLDGTGYPDGLKGDEIPLIVQIASVADSFDAMTSSRAYRKGMPVEKAMMLLYEDAAKGKIALEIVDVLADMVREGVAPVSGLQTRASSQPERQSLNEEAA